MKKRRVLRPVKLTEVFVSTGKIKPPPDPKTDFQSIVTNANDLADAQLLSREQAGGIVNGPERPLTAQMLRDTMREAERFRPRRGNPLPPRDYAVPDLRQNRPVTDVYGDRQQIFDLCEGKNLEVVNWYALNQLSVILAIADMRPNQVTVRGLRIWARHWRLQDVIRSLNETRVTDFDSFVFDFQRRVNRLYDLSNIHRDSIQYEPAYDIQTLHSTE